MFQFSNGAYAITDWQGATVAKDWILSRKSWGKPTRVETRAAITPNTQVTEFQYL